MVLPFSPVSHVNSSEGWKVSCAARRRCTPVISFQRRRHNDRSIRSEAFSPLERVRSRRKIIAIGVFRLVMAVLFAVLAAAVGFFAWIRIFSVIHLHGLR